jgi:hypothetical protein
MSEPVGPRGGHPQDDLAAYALAALDEAERQAVDEHLAGCPVCRDELAVHHETLAALTPEEAPPAAVWQRVAASIGAPGLPDPHDVGPPRATTLPPTTSEVPGRRQRAAADGAGAGDGATISPLARPQRAAGRSPLRLGWLAAAASVAVVAAASGNDADIGALAEQASEDPDQVLATLADAEGQPVARVVADEDGAFMLLEGLQDLPEGRAYQLWSLTGTEPVSLGMLGREGTNTVAFRLPPTITELAISVEPTSGEVAPTGQFQASGDVTQRS